MKNTMSILGLAVALSVPAVASADERPSLAEESGAREHLMTPVGTAVTLGGGISNFARQSIRDITSVAGAWDARVAFGTRSIIGGELAYVGGVRSISATGIANDASLLNNGAEATVRANAPFEVGAMLLEPFTFAGLGFSHYNLRNANNVSDNIANTDNIGTVPMGLGFAFAWNGFIADARATYRLTFNDRELVKGDDTDLQSWAVGATVGYEF